MTGVTSFPGPSANLTRVVIFFREGCRTKVLREHDDPLWDGGTAGVATFTYNANNPTIVPTPTIHDTNVWDARFGQAHPYKHDQLHGDGAVYRPRRLNPQNGGHIFAYACGPTDHTTMTTTGQPVIVEHSGECRVARAAVTATMDLSDLGDRMSWRYLDNDGVWAACESPCSNSQLRSVEASQRSMEPPGTCNAAGTDCSSMPQHFLVNYSDQLGAFVAVAPRFALARFADTRVWLAERAIGPWSTPTDLPVSCDGRPRVFGTLVHFNCYQVETHTGVPGPDGDTTFGYYDVFNGSNADTDPNRTRRNHAIRFMSAPLCVIGGDTDTGQGAGVDYAVGRCLFRDQGSATDTITRQEVAAIIWRLDGRRTGPTSGPSPAGVDNRHLQSVRYLLSSDKAYDEVWSATTDFGPATSRADLIALLWRLTPRVPADFPDDPTPEPAGWDDIPDYAVDAYRWAYATKVTCADPVHPTAAVTRQVAGDWLQRFLTVADCTSTAHG